MTSTTTRTRTTRNASKGTVPAQGDPIGTEHAAAETLAAAMAAGEQSKELETVHPLTTYELSEDINTPAKREARLLAMSAERTHGLAEIVMLLATSKRAEDHKANGNDFKNFAEYRTARFPLLRKPSEAERVALYPILASEFGLTTTRQLADVLMVSNAVVSLDQNKHAAAIPAEFKQSDNTDKEEKSQQSRAAASRKRDQGKAARDAEAKRTITITLPDGADVEAFTARLRDGKSVKALLVNATIS